MILRNAKRNTLGSEGIALGVNLRSEGIALGSGGIALGNECFTL